MGVIQEDPVVGRDRIHSMENGSQSRAEVSGASSGGSWGCSGHVLSPVMTEEANARLTS